MKTLIQQEVFVHGIYINDNHELLLEKRGSVWTLPWGKLKPHETDIECLMREGRRKFPSCRIEVGDGFGVFIGLFPRTKREIKGIMYWMKIHGNLFSRSCSEKKKKKFKFVPFIELVNYSISKISTRAIYSLVKGGYFW